MKEIDKELTRISDLILQQGRSYKCSFVYISHQANNYKATRNILNEAHHIVVFPSMSTRYSLNYLFGKYFGFNNLFLPFGFPFVNLVSKMRPHPVHKATGISFVILLSIRPA